MIPITRPWLGEDEVAAAGVVIRSGWLSQGEKVEEFERIVAGYVGAQHAIAVSNCTVALHLALLSHGIAPGDEVICPSFTFIATANSIVHSGARPVFVDIEPSTYNIDPDLIEAAITPRTRAIVPVDQIGLAADIPAIREIARRHNLVLVEDAAPSLGATIDGKPVGGFGHITCFSFHPRKSITTGEGGIITTDDADRAAWLRRVRSHAASTSDLQRHKATNVALEEYRELGFNYRMTDLQAAIGSVQMRKLDTILQERRRLAYRYAELLGGGDWLELPFEPPGRPHTFQSYCVRLPASLDRNAIMERMAELGVATRRGVMAIHLEPFYRDQSAGVRLPITERMTAETILLPLFVGMTDDQQVYVAESLRQASTVAVLR